MPREARNQAAGPSYVVIGASAGGGEALSEVFKSLPQDFPGALLMVLHVRELGGMSWLAERLMHLGHLPVKVAEDGDAIRQGTAYIAPSSTHLLADGDRIRLGTGPPEQRSRPAIDVLFRSAAETLGRQVIGVILTGMLRDGTRGLAAVRDAGGITVVQDPRGAMHGDMPRNAMRNLDVDYCVALPDIGPLLDLLVRRAGSRKRAILETGLVSSVRQMKDRVLLLRRLDAQSRRNPKTARFLEAEIAALDREIGVIRRLIPRRRSRTRGRT